MCACRSKCTYWMGATAPQRCELFVNYFAVYLTGRSSIPEVRELFEQARQEYGMGELQENGLPDWTDGYDIADYIDENDLPYERSNPKGLLRSAITAA